MGQALPDIPASELSALVRAVRVAGRDHAISARNQNLRAATLTFAVILVGILHSVPGRAWNSPQAHFRAEEEPEMFSAMRALVMSSTLFAASGALAQNAVEWRVQDGGNGHWYGTVEWPTPVWWGAARTYAIANGAMLACLNTQAEDTFVTGLAASRPSVWNGVWGPWIGASGQAPCSNGSACFTWEDGTSLTYARWHPGNPDNITWQPDTVGVLLWEPNWTRAWQDSSLSAGPNSCRSAVLEWSADCNGDGMVDYGQIQSGQLADANGNNIPDICETTITVPTQFPTIQAAIDSVPSGAAKVISVLPGTYNQAFALNGKNVVVRGAANNATVLDGTGLTEAICRFTGGEPATAGVERLVFRNGTVGSKIYPKASFRVGGAIYGANSSAFIRNCVFQSNTSDFGGGAYIYRSEIMVDGCQFAANIGRNMGGGLMFFQSSGTVSGCGFTGNIAAQFGAGSGSAFKAVGAKTPGGTVALTNCSIQGGIGGDGASAVEMFGDETGVPGVMRISNCQISGNSSGGASTNGGGLRVVGPASCCILTEGTTICGNTPRNVSGPFLIEGTATVCDCLADVTLDRAVNGADLGVVLAAWGTAPANGAGDVNHDGAVDGTDLAMVLAGWGQCP